MSEIIFKSSGKYVVTILSVSDNNLGVMYLCNVCLCVGGGVGVYACTCVWRLEFDIR